jgi:hypothetical protein
MAPDCVALHGGCAGERQRLQRPQLFQYAAAALLLQTSWAAWWVSTLDLSSRALAAMTMPYLAPTMVDAELRWRNAFAWMTQANLKAWHRKSAEQALERYFKTLEEILEANAANRQA